MNRPSQILRVIDSELDDYRYIESYLTDLQSRNIYVPRFFENDQGVHKVNPNCTKTLLIIAEFMDRNDTYFTAIDISWIKVVDPCREIKQNELEGFEHFFELANNSSFLMDEPEEFQIDFILTIAEMMSDLSN